MFDVFQNVLFGKKKSNTDSEKDKSSDSDDFVLVGQSSNAAKETASNQGSEAPLTAPYPNFPSSGTTLTPYNLLAPKKPEEKQSIIMPLQDVPFVINSALQSSAKLDQIWQTVAPCVDSINSFHHFQDDYDFNLEKSVISEINNK